MLKNYLLREWKGEFGVSGGQKHCWWVYIMKMASSYFTFNFFASFLNKVQIRELMSLPMDMTHLLFGPLFTQSS